MSPLLLLTVLSLLLAMATSAQQVDLLFNGFRSTPNLTLNGFAKITPDGLLKLTNNTMELGHAFFSDPVTFKNSPNSSALSFSSTFVFASVAPYTNFGGHGIAFVIAPDKTLVGARPSQYLGLFNESNNGNTTNHVFAVEFDNIQNTDFKDINNNHVGVDINSLASSVSAPAGYFSSSGSFVNMSLLSGLAMQAWVDYDGPTKQITVTLAPFKVPKPNTPLLSKSIDLTSVLNQTMFVGFSASTGSLPTSYCVLGWSFKNINGEARELALKKLPKLPRIKHETIPWLLTVGIPILSLVLISAIIIVVLYYLRRKKKFAEVLEDWERNYGPQRYKYKDLYVATNGFKDQFLLGRGGFGRVYKGVLPTSKIEIAVKRVSHESRQGIREFVSEISSIGRLRHRNLVSLLGYCRRKDELLLVYDYMPNGSLDKYLYNQPDKTLTWSTRYRVIKGVASGLLYLHEGWEQVVLHRDIKASNILLDAEFNGRLGDFGLARLYDHGTDPQTTHVVGTLGYLAPEHTRTGKSTKATDVFAFGAFLLEVVTGRRPIEVRETEDVILVDWVFSFWSRGEILAARDTNLGDDFVGEEVELVLKLGLMCSQWEAGVRPTMRQVVQYLEGDKAGKELSSDLEMRWRGLTYGRGEGFDDFAMCYSSSTSVEKPYSTMSSIAESHLSCGR